VKRCSSQYYVLINFECIFYKKIKVKCTCGNMFTAGVCCSSHGSEDVTAKSAPIIKVQQPLGDGRKEVNFIFTFWIVTDPISLLILLLFLFFLLCDALEKSLSSVVSNQIGMKFGRNVPQVYTHQLAESDF